MMVSQVSSPCQKVTDEISNPVEAVFDALDFHPGCITGSQSSRTEG